MTDMEFLQAMKDRTVGFPKPRLRHQEWIRLNGILHDHIYFYNRQPEGTGLWIVLADELRRAVLLCRAQLLDKIKAKLLS